MGASDPRRNLELPVDAQSTRPVGSRYRQEHREPDAHRRPPLHHRAGKGGLERHVGATDRGARSAAPLFGGVVFCRPGLEPGPIRRGVRDKTRRSTAFAQQQTAVVMGPGVRRNDREGAGGDNEATAFHCASRRCDGVAARGARAAIAHETDRRAGNRQCRRAVVPERTARRPARIRSHRRTGLHDRFRSAKGQLSRLPELASELVRLKVDVIVALYTPCALAAKEATREIPIVILSGDPVVTGLVESLSRPGANVTGLSQLGAEVHGKCVELFRDMLPSARRIAAIANADDPLFAKTLIEHIRRAGSGTGTEINPVVMVRSPDELEAAVATVVKEKADALVYQASLPTKRMVELTLAHRLPAATGVRAFAEIGGLMSYGADGPALFRYAATFVHKIFQGEKPADLPVEQPVKFELVINLKTAQVLGLAIPPALLARADDVIE